MSINTILFDLDGTLLAMDQDKFIMTAFSGILKKISEHHMHRTQVGPMLISGIRAMEKNNGECTNEELFWSLIKKRFKKKSDKILHILEDYYQHDFQKLGKLCGDQPGAKDLIEALKESGVRLVLATKPLFPRYATEARLRWAGFEPHDFEYITTYENSRYCKPSIDYYREILRNIDASPETCLMVGNDVGEDMIARELGVNVFLLTNHLINKKKKDIDDYPSGDFGALYEYIKNNIRVYGN